MTTTPQPEPVDDSLVFVDQARWLLEWHNRRSESFATRAVAVLGFDGVIMALLLQGFGLPGLDAHWGIWTFLVLTAVLLLVSAGYAVGTIVAMTVAVPGIEDLREGWATHRNAPVSRYAGPLVSESLLNSSDLAATSPVDSASEEADTRAERFTIAISALLAALVSAAILALLLLAQA